MAPLAVLRFRQFTQNVTQMGHTNRSHPHSIEHDTQPIAYLISKQAIPYQTRANQIKHAKMVSLYLISSVDIKMDGQDLKPGESVRAT
jgi:hypothetical protein